MKREIFLQPFGTLEPGILQRLMKDLKWYFKSYPFRFKIEENAIGLRNAPFNPISKQYNGEYIIDKLKRLMSDKDHFRTLGVVSEDIYAGTKNFIFGWGKYPKNDSLKYHGVAIISVARLNENFYRRPKDQALFEKRILKEAVHELGHTFNLKHCMSNCVMQFSESLYEADKKPIDYCPTCKKHLRYFLSTLG